jgi:hypothetical protein
MAAELAVDRLRDYLRRLPPGARDLLIKKLEGDASRGDAIPGGDVLLQELRSALRQSGEPAARGDTPARLFFAAVEPFLTDDDPVQKRQGRIARASLEPIWTWICRDLVADEAKAYCDEVSRALAAEDSTACESLTQAFQNTVVEHLRAQLDAVKNDDKARRRMIGQIGTPRAIEEIRDLLPILSGRHAFALIARRLPDRIRNLADVHLESVKGVLDALVGAQDDLLPYALILVMGRLAAPWQLIRIAVKAADSDDAIRIAATPYAAAVTLTLADIECMVGELETGLKRGPGVAVTSLIKSIHDAVRGLRTELDLGLDSPWMRKLAAIRSEISIVLKAEIESMPGRVRRLLRPRPSGEIGQTSVLDPSDVAETEALIEFVGTCRNHAGELAISEMSLRAYNEVQQSLDTGSQALLDRLRNAGDADRPFRQSQVDATVRFCAKVFGADYAAVLSKAAEVAASSERKAAAKA